MSIELVYIADAVRYLGTADQRLPRWAREYLASVTVPVGDWIEKRGGKIKHYTPKQFASRFHAE